ncbi:MAG: hypothetical protein LPK45_05135, partial [Bacteroidota bacterium]|nr:hypothetical protein [Bacteroidota bacterium]MDX5430444.1 hypothetical protein [Bacteroidota bacterium]MDX5469203.1 hypothetical protein [Bacteroidota bacterium]
VLSLIPRLVMFNFESGDYTGNLSLWYDTLEREGFRSLKENFHNYTPPYLYLMYLTTFLPLPKLWGIKLISLIFDYVLAFGVYRLMRQQFAHRISLFTGVLVLYLPTVLMNASLWAQCDSIYASFLVLAMNEWMQKEEKKGMFYFGLAFAFKIQAIFLILVPMALWIQGKISFKSWFLIPALYVLAILPNWIAGRSLLSLLGIYVSQGEAHPGQTSFAPNVYQWLTWAPNELFTRLGIAFVGSIMVLFAILFWKIRWEWTKKDFIQIALFSALFIPFFLPRMHDRYFFVADVLSVVYAFYFANRWFVPVMVVSASFFSYLYFLFSTLTIFPFSVLAVLMALALIIVSKDLFTRIFHEILSNPTSEKS